MNFEVYLAAEKRRIDEALDRLLPRPEGPARTVVEAMRYAVLSPGKRLRPILAFAAYEACSGTASGMLEAACALELIHSYSLIHDDLPAMDDDDLRRGRPTLHRAFGEAEAILAGDALLTLAFEWLADGPPDADSSSRRAAAVVVAARAAGIGGMVGGQVADLESEGEAAELARLQWIHAHKTGSLFAASAEIGSIHAGADPARRRALSEYGAALGLAFQIADDLLDLTATAEILGKTPGKDLRAGKATFPALLGLEASAAEAQALSRRALEPLAPLGLCTATLQSLADHAVSRAR